MIVTRITHKPIHKPVWDVHTNGNVFPGLTVWDVHKNRNVFLDSLCVMYIPTEMIFWDSPCGMYIPTEMIGFPWVTRSHTSSSGVPGGPIPEDFWVVWEGPPYRPHSLGDGSKCRRGKGLKTVCIAPTCTSER